jgi:hypothetical protein
MDTGTASYASESFFLSWLVVMICDRLSSSITKVKSNQHMYIKSTAHSRQKAKGRTYSDCCLWWSNRHTKDSAGVKSLATNQAKGEESKSKRKQTSTRNNDDDDNGHCWPLSATGHRPMGNGYANKQNTDLLSPILNKIQTQRRK